jgi:hypothetical protein
MMNERITVQLDEELNNTIQYLFYMVESYKEVINDLLSNKRNINANKELLDHYNNEYINYNMQLSAIKEEAIKALCNVPEGKKAIYYIDFIKQCIVITDIVDII